jgi:hypothetical protein
MIAGWARKAHGDRPVELLATALEKGRAEMAFRIRHAGWMVAGTL